MHEQAISSEAQTTLESLKSLSVLHDFYLAGGTAVALYLGHRISVDLDFFSPKIFLSEELKQKIKQNCDVQMIQQKEGTLEVILSETRVSFLYYPYAVLDDFFAYGGVDIASLRDIALMKLVAIANRGSRKDFVDVYAICRQKFALPDLVQDFGRKYASQDFDLYHILKSLVFFEDAEREPELNLLQDIPWEEVKDFFVQTVKKIQI